MGDFSISLLRALAELGTEARKAEQHEAEEADGQAAIRNRRQSEVTVNAHIRVRRGASMVIIAKRSDGNYLRIIVKRAQQAANRVIVTVNTKGLASQQGRCAFIMTKISKSRTTVKVSSIGLDGERQTAWMR